MRKIRPHQIAQWDINEATGEENPPPPEGSVGTVDANGDVVYALPPSGGMRYRGDWVAVPTGGQYEIGHVVMHLGGKWMATQAGAVGQPSEFNTAWTLIEPDDSGGSTGPGIVLIEAGETAPPAGTAVGTVVARKAAVA
jgi:hypothetical protein